jgi:hypothetical protein
MQIASSGKNKDMVRYALGALRNLANDTAVQVYQEALSY